MEKAFKKMAQVFGYPNREYKDRVFRMLLKEPKVALEVYNAMNGTSYDNPDELIITTMERTRCRNRVFCVCLMLTKASQKN